MTLKYMAFKQTKSNSNFKMLKPKMIENYRTPKVMCLSGLSMRYWWSKMWSDVLTASFTSFLANRRAFLISSMLGKPMERMMDKHSSSSILPTARTTPSFRVLTWGNNNLRPIYIDVMTSRINFLKLV